MNFNALLAKAKENQGIKSNRQLALLMGLNISTLAQFTTGRASPSERILLHLAKLAGVDPTIEVLEHRVDRAKDDDVAELYRDVIRRIGKTAAGVLIAAMVATFPTLQPAPAFAGTNGEQMSRSIARFNDYRIFRQRRRGWLARLLGYFNQG